MLFAHKQKQMTMSYQTHSACVIVDRGKSVAHVSVTGSRGPSARPAGHTAGHVPAGRHSTTTTVCRDRVVNRLPGTRERLVPLRHGVSGIVVVRGRQFGSHSAVCLQLAGDVLRNICLSLYCDLNVFACVGTSHIGRASRFPRVNDVVPLPENL